VRIKKQCYESVTFDTAKNICEDAGGRLCTLYELENNCAVGGCGFNKKIIWSSDDDTTLAKEDEEDEMEDLVPEPECNMVVCGRSGKCKEDKHCRGETEVAAVKCCSDTFIGRGWASKGDCGIFRKTKINGKCYGQVTFDEAEEICEDAGARLCTENELERDCAVGGCGFDQKMIWAGNA